MSWHKEDEQTWGYNYSNSSGVRVRDQGMTETSDRSNRWKPRLMRSFRVSEHLEEMIKQECKRRKTDFSSFMRAAALGAMRNRTYHRGDVGS